MFRILMFTLIVASCAAYVNKKCPSHLKKTELLRQYGSYCYEFVLDKTGTWQNALDDCWTKHGYLTDIQSTDENVFIYTTLQTLSSSDVWIGLKRLHDGIKGKKWTWYTHPYTNDKFTRWATGEPRSLIGYEDCAIMKIRYHGSWGARPCVLEKHGWICKYKIENN